MSRHSLQGSALVALALLGLAAQAVLAVEDCDWRPHCSPGETSRHAIPCKGHCNRYFQCADGLPVLKKCNFLQKFDANKSKCVWMGADCGWFLHESDDDEDDGPTPTPGVCGQPNCPKKGRSLLPDPCPNACQHYYSCDGGVATPKLCAPWNNFHPVQLKCVIWDKVDCTWANPTTPRPPPTTTTTTTTTTTPAPPPTTPKPPCKFTPTCPSEGEAVIADPCRCQAYYTCAEGVATHKLCSAWENFDPEKLKCNWYSAVDCSWPSRLTTTPSTPTEQTTPVTDIPSTETDQPTSETEPTEAPITEAPTTEAPTTEAPTTEAPTTEAPTTEAPTTDAPTTEAPTTEAPTTEAPTTEAPTTEVPTTEAPTTEAPTTEAPTTEAPTTEAPTTEAPTTEAPTTEAPTTEAPTTEAPTTEAPTTEAPTTEAPTTEAPTTETPTTEAPTTEAPTTEAPTTEAPTTTTEAPTTTTEATTTTTETPAPPAPTIIPGCDFAPECPASGESKLAIPCSGWCSHYVQCKDGDASLVKCSFRRHFDSVSLACAMVQYKCLVD